MNVFDGILLGIVQGLTEFFPVSSKTHVILVSYFLGIQMTLAFAVVVHIGSVIAEFFYFKNDIIRLTRAFIQSILDVFKGRFRKEFRENEEKKLAWLILIGVIPAGILGTTSKKFFEKLFSNPNLLTIGLLLIFTGLLLYIGEEVGKRIKNKKRSAKDMGIKDALLIGIAQACALTPGISRSGSTISVGLILGLKRELSARYSFLLSIPAILGALIVELKEITLGFWLMGGAYLGGLIATAIAVYVAVRTILKIAPKRSFTIFSYYCWIVGISILLYYLVIK